MVCTATGETVCGLFATCPRLLGRRLRVVEVVVRRLLVPELLGNGICRPVLVCSVSPSL